jgi:glycosyltransferase involved in cell wall biosynthesis
MAKVSLIMLVYKTEPYIEKSLRSALEQTFDDLEIVIVNDATPDGSMAIVENVLREYPHRKGQVKIISHPINRGIAVARQTAIDNATGEYTIHLDSDDWMEPRMVERMYECAKKDAADIVVCDYYADFSKRRTYNSQPAPSTGKECTKALLKGNLHGSLWNKLIRRNLYVEHKVRFVPGIDLLEDLMVTVKLSYFADKVSYIPEAFLHYNQDNMQAITRTFSPKKIDNMIRAMEHIEDFVKDHGGDGEWANDIMYRKLLVRGALIHHTRGAEQRKMIGLYPDIPRSYILKQPNAMLPSRIAHFLASVEQLPAANLIYGVADTLRKMK